MKSKKAFGACSALGVVCLCLTLAGPARAQVEHATIALPAIASLLSSEYIAEDAGIYKKNGLDVKEEIIAGIGSANAVINGSIDFSQSSGPTLTRAVAHHQALMAIADTYDRPGFSVVVTKKVADARQFDANAPLAERARIMKGLRLSIAGFRAIPDAYLRVIAKAGGLDPETDMTLSAVLLPDMIPATERGQLDGFAAVSPILEEAVDSGLGVIIANGIDMPVDPPWLGRVAANVLIVRPQTCEQRPSLCEKMGRSMVEANAYLHDHPKESMAILGKRLFIKDPKVLADSYRRIAEASPSPPLVDAKEIETADDLNVAAGYMKASEKLGSYASIFTNQYLK